MRRIVYILFFVLNVSFSQQNLKHEVYFETDKFEIPSTELNRLLLFLNQLEELDIEKISIYGLTDDRGSDAYNEKLSQQRADAIKHVISENEFEESLITNVDGKGKILLKIVKESDVQKIRGLKRKVEIIVTHKIKKTKVLENVKKKSTNKEI